MMFSESDLKIIYSAVSRIDAEYENLYDLRNFPPFGTKYEEFFGKEDYIADLIDARMDILRNQTNLLMGDYDLFLNFKKKYAKSIKEAKRYKKESNDDSQKAFDLFEKEKGIPETGLGSPRKEWTPW